jgi:hypothetical protein
MFFLAFQLFFDRQVAAASAAVVKTRLNFSFFFSFFE